MEGITILETVSLYNQFYPNMACGMLGATIFFFTITILTLILNPSMTDDWLKFPPFSLTIISMFLSCCFLVAGDCAEKIEGYKVLIDTNKINYEEFNKKYEIVITNNDLTYIVTERDE